ncbi:UNVERIFIED_CONTAM: hypothetical protein GTU68_033094 [Idotea baltica]|nr:hypothetical protein [Idotea baltica]
MVPHHDLEEVLTQIQDSGQTPLLVALDQVSDVRNFGAIARSAECMGAQALIIGQEGAARINADAIKVSVGALNYLPVVRVLHLQDMVMLAQSFGIQVVGMSEKAADTIYEADLTQPTILVMGSEEKGISKRILNSSDKLVKIPMQGNIHSLNVSVATGMALSEALRQRLGSTKDA